METLAITYRDERDRWVRGDYILRRWARRLLLSPPNHLSGMRRIVANFRRGLQEEGRRYRFNPLPWTLPRDQTVISFGLGPLGLKGIRADNPVIAAIGFPYPPEFPDLCQRYNVKLFLQHSAWVLELAKSANLYPGLRYDVWHAGIDVNDWRPPSLPSIKDIDVLIYYKIHWERPHWDSMLVAPIKQELSRCGRTYHQIEYGGYSPAEYKALLARAKALLFLSPHESQGLAYQESLSCDVPVLAWDPGRWLDPERLKYGLDFVQATSVPFFDERCGQKFRDADEFMTMFPAFWEQCEQSAYRPREYVLENLTIANSTRRMLELYNAI